MSVKERPLLAKALPATRPGRFPIGRLQLDARKRPREEVAWDPWSRDQPHCLVSGETGSGKSRLLELWALEALEWEWQVQVLDVKGGADFHVAAQRGAQLIWNENWIGQELAAIAAEINRRNAIMRDLAVLVTDSSGRTVESRATRLADLPPSMREEMQPRLVLLDEAASLVALDRQANGKKGEKAPSDSLRKAVQLGRSAGVHLVLSIQRPDAEFLSGFTKNNLGDRIMLGAPRTWAADAMMFDLPPEDKMTEAVRHSPRGVGVALVQGCGLPVLSRVRCYLLDRERLLADASSSEPDAEPEQTDPEPETIVPAPGVGPRDESSDEPWFEVRSEPPLSDPRGMRLPRRGRRPPRVRPSKSPRARSPGLLAPRLRAALRGPGARLRLRAGASALLRAPLANASRTRSPELRAAALARDGSACRACGATHRPLQVDHRVPLWASGPDTLENVWVLDVKCHKAKTRAEAAVRALRRRNGGRAPWAGRRLAWRLREIPLLRSVYGWLYVAAFFAGLALPQYRLGALIGLAFVTVGIAILSSLLGMKPSGYGLDRTHTWDRKLEMAERGTFGRIARAHWAVTRELVLLRMRLAISCALFAAGGFAPQGWTWISSQAPLI